MGAASRTVKSFSCTVVRKELTFLGLCSNLVTTSLHGSVVEAGENKNGGIVIHCFLAVTSPVATLVCNAHDRGLAMKAGSLGCAGLAWRQTGTLRSVNRRLVVELLPCSLRGAPRQKDMPYYSPQLPHSRGNCSRQAFEKMSPRQKKQHTHTLLKPSMHVRDVGDDSWLQRGRHSLSTTRSPGKKLRYRSQPLQAMSRLPSRRVSDEDASCTPEEKQNHASSPPWQAADRCDLGWDLLRHIRHVVQLSFFVSTLDGSRVLCPALPLSFAMKTTSSRC